MEHLSDMKVFNSVLGEASIHPGCLTRVVLCDRPNPGRRLLSRAVEPVLASSRNRLQGGLFRNYCSSW